MDASFHEYIKAVIIDPYESPLQWITKIRKKTLALGYLATFEPIQIILALDNRAIPNFIKNL